MSTRVVAVTGGVELSPDEYGSKAATLGLLARLGYRCPPGVAVGATEYRNAIDALGEPDVPNPLDPTSRATWFHEAVQSLSIEDALTAEIVQEMEALGAPPPWIVRSSAVGEDSGTSSFAGQLDSIADVDAASLADAIRSVWASAWASRAMSYRLARGLDNPDDLPVAVLIQPYVEPDVAGVAFTSSPLPGEEGMLVECVSGRGEQLVSGSVAPVRYTFDEFGFPSGPEGSDVDLPREVLRELWSVGTGLADQLGGPQDIEWVYATGQLQLVQARPITTLTARSSRLADVSDFAISIAPVTFDERDKIPASLVERDKFRLRLIATEAGILIGSGWLISVERHSDSGAGAGQVGTVSSTLAAGLTRSGQVSLVLQDPPRFGGGILRQFSHADEIATHLSRMVGQVGAEFTAFKFIATEILQARLSGISHIIDDQLVVEVAFGSYVPKGVVPTSLYVVGRDGGVEQHVPSEQTSAIFIEAGTPTERPISEPVHLSEAQLQEIRRLTEAVAADYPGVSVEFGVLEDGTPYLIDIIPDMSPVAIRDVRVMSEGRITGITTISASDDLAAQSLDAHFHSERGGEPAEGGAKTIVVAPRPFLALEAYLGQHGAGSVGFVFEQGSLLGHLAIILREHAVPAVVIPDACAVIPAATNLTIDTSTEELISTIQESDA